MLSGVVLRGGFWAEGSPCCGAASRALLQGHSPERCSVTVLPGYLLAAVDALHGPDSVTTLVQSEPQTLAMSVMANARKSVWMPHYSSLLFVVDYHTVLNESVLGGQM